MAYYLTPAERRARAQALIQQRKNVVAYNKYLKQQKDYERQVAQAKLDEENRQKQIESQDFFTRAISTIGDISANIITGALKGLEGIYDLGAGIVGAVGGIFSDDFQDSVKSHIATDWVGKYIGDPLQELTKYSYTKNGGIIEGVASGIGQMLPAVAVTIATGGAGAPAAVAQMASLATLGASAAGNATEQAYNDGASYWGGLGYGIASGAVEMATEKMFGGFGKLAGAGYLDNVTRSIAKQGVARIAKEAVEEGVEEVVAELANPALKAIYKGGEAFQEYGDSEYWKGVGQAGLIGGLTSMAYGQSVGRVLHTSGKYADVSEALAEFNSLQKKAQNLAETGRLYEKGKNGKANSDNIHDSMVANLRLVEQTVQKVDESKRASFIKKAGLSEVINPDGTIKPEFAMSRGLTDMVAQQSTEGDNKPQSPLASQPRQYRTAFADERVLQEALDRGGAKPFVGEMTAEQAADFGDFTRVFGKLANKSNGFLKFVVGENVAGNSYIDTQTGTVVMGIDQFGKGTSGVDLASAVITSDMWQKSAIHEVKHSTEGTKQDAKLTRHLYEDNAVFAEARDSFLRRGYFEERVGKDTAKAGEYLDSLLVKVDEVMRSKPKNVSMEEHIAANLTSEEIQDYRMAQSEIGAIAAENVLGNEDFIKKLLRKDTNFAQKVLNRIMDMKEAFASLKSKEARAAYAYLQKAEKLYLKAIEEVGAKFQKRRIIGIRRLEEGEEIDANPQMLYNEGAVGVQQSRKDSLIYRTFPTYKEGKGTQANELATRWAHRADIQSGDLTAISFNDSWYLIEKFDDSEWGYQIIDKLTEKEYLTYEEEWNNGNRQGQSIQKGISRFTSLDRRGDSSIQGESNNDSSRPRQRGENQEVRGVGEEQSQRGQTQSDRSGDSKSRRSSEQGLRYSLKSVAPVQPTSKAWTPTIDTDEVLKRFPNLWNVKAEESEVRNPTQIKGTVSTYRKIYDILKEEGFKGKILDASSGLGYGTQAGIEEYGFNVEDIEPYPDSKYKPKYTDYSTLNERYDVIISNAVLNVLPQDQRDALVVKMGELLNVGGRLFVNVRGDDVNNLASNPANVKIGGMEWYVTPTGSYQKGFTRAELVAYLQDALGKNFSVVPTTQFGKTSAIVTKRAEGIKFSLSDTSEGFMHHDREFYETEKGKRIASTMNMETCKQMIERVYYLTNPNQYEESPIYKNAEHWLSIVGADEVALYIENEYILQEKYLNKIPAVLDGDVYVAQIIEAYQDKALNGGNNKRAAKRLNVAEGVETNDSRFYAPQRVEEAKKLYEVANQKVTNSNRSEVTEARARILIFAHNRGAASELGITQNELNKKLRSWSNYSANAREISQRINEGIAFANMWSGIENSSYLYNATITEEDFAPLVGKIEGRSSEYERRYIANTMLALDTHIDYTGINFVFGENFTEKGVRGKYSDSDRTVRVRGGVGQQTVAHEIGHAIDHQWARDVWNWVGRKSTGTNNGLSEGLNLDLITIPEVRQWVENYFAFIDNISDSGNIHSEYLQSKNETFARFVAQFVDWTVQLASGRSSFYSFSDFNDKFTMSQFVEFARILQEKAKLDSQYTFVDTNGGDEKSIKFSFKDSEGRALSDGQREFFQDSQVRDEEGNLLVVYHGTADEFTVFDKSFIGSNFGQDEFGFFFTDKENVAVGYADYTTYGTKRAKSGYVKQVYLNITNPLTIQIDYDSIGYWDENYERIIKRYQKGNYDGIIIKAGKFDSLYIVENSNQIKLVSNESPTLNEDIRFSRKRTPVEEIHRTYYTLSDGQIKKLLANNMHYKVYSKVDAERIINNVLQQYMTFGEKYGEISGKSKAEVIDMLWKGLNAAEPGKQMGVALHIADYIIQNSVLENIYNDEDVQVATAIDIIDALKPYLHSINLESLKEEIKYKYDKDNSAYLLWGKRKGDKGIGVDQIAQALEEQGIRFSAINEADIFFEIDAQYRQAVKALKKRAKDMLAETLPKEQLKALKQEIAREILKGYDYTGKSSKLSEVLDKYRKQISMLYDKLRDSNRHNRATNRLLDKVQKIKDWKTGAFVNSSKFRPKLFKGSIERLAMIKNRGNLNQSGTRRILAGLAEWYTKDNPLLGYVDAEHKGQYNEEIASILQAVAQNQKPLTDEQVDLIAYLQERSGISDYKGLLDWYTKANLKKGYSAEVKSLLRELASETTFTTEELIALEKVVGYFGNLIENHNKVIRNGKYVDAKPIAERYIDTLKRNKGVKVGWFGKFFDKVFNNGKASYLQTFADPMTVARYMDKYESGFYTEMLEELRNGAIRADVTEMNIRLPLEEFLTKHKKYGKGVSKRTITYRGVSMPALDAFLLYLTLNREQALAGLAESGFTFNNGKETIRVDGFAKGIEDLTLDELREMAKAEQDELFKQFTEEDKEFILIAEKIFNEDCKETKRATDMLRLGYSNVFEGYYVPIRRANSAITIDTSTFFEEMNRVSNASFNKDTVQGAKGELFIEGLDEVLDRHIHGVSQYAALAPVIDQYDILYNLNMAEDANKPKTVRTESENTWAKGNDYFKKLISDIQGISPTRGGGSKLFGFLRGSYAKYQLGLNPKVWLTQLSSIFASSSILDYSSIIKGFGIKAPDVDDYCSLAAVRNNDNSAAMAQSVLDKVDKFGSALMKPIGKVDRFVIKRLFGACQVQVQKENGLKVGTKENKIKAGELLEKVILETQQNSMATERSAAMRSGSELMKTLTMFTADSMKVFGRVVDSFGEVSVLKHKIKETTDPKEKEALQAQLKTATKKARKSVTALAATAIFMALVAQAFRWLYGKDDDDENALETMTVDAIGNLMGGLPLIKDIYAKLTEGYDLNNYAYSAINDLFDAFASAVNFSEGKPAKKVKDIVYAVGQLFGIPTRNVYNIFYGLTKKFSPTTAYEIDNVFYNKNYSSDLQKAIDNDDEEMISTIMGLMLDEKVGSIDSTTVRNELNNLISKGYKVLPRSIGNSITYNGEEIALTTHQREQFKSIYSEANNALASLVEGKSYRSASEEVKAKAIGFIWDIYYNLAIEDLLGVDLETKNTLFAKAIDISSLAIIVATARGLEADTDKKGKVISGSKKAKVQGYINSLGLKAAQKYMIMGYLGYTNKNGESQVRSYIQRLRLSKSEKERLFEYSGYAA